MNGNPPEAVRTAIIEEASQWHARYLSGEMTAAQKVEFLQWLQDSPRNVQEYLKTTQMAQLMPGALQGLDLQNEHESSMGANVVPLASAKVRSPRPARRVILATAASLLVVAVLLTVMKVWDSRVGQLYSAAHGDQRTLHLSDGSLIHLNSSSRARVRFSQSQRLVELQEGQAMFEVAHDPDRPFRVQTEQTEVLAIGTRFDVYRRNAGHIVVTVVEGRVDVGESSADKARIRLSVGQQADLRDGHPIVADADLDSATAWIRREIVFSGRTLAEVADEFNRYLRVPIHIEDANLRSTRISGVFSAYDEAAFIAFLREFDNVDVEPTADAVYVRSRTIR